MDRNTMEEIIKETILEMLQDEDGELIELMMAHDSVYDDINEETFVDEKIELLKEDLGINIDEYVPEDGIITEERIKMLKLSGVLNEAVDKDAATELEMFIDNDGQLYRQNIQPIIKNLKKKFKKGTYDQALAVKGWMYAVDAGAKKYAKEFSIGTDWNTMFTKETRLAVAKSLEQNHKEEVEED